MTITDYYNARKDSRGRTRLRRSWENMLTRCYYQNKGRVYQRYGGRGISVCDEWRASFDDFRDWALSNGYEEDLELDRIDNDGNYQPDNCHFVTHKDNNRNRRNCRLISFDGKEQCLAAWAEELGINYETLRTRFRLNWDVERAFTTEVEKDEKQD